jgi:hypothetical protein
MEILLTCILIVLLIGQGFQMALLSLILSAMRERGGGDGK